jgi:hypothetical protein
MPKNESKFLKKISKVFRHLFIVRTGNASREGRLSTVDLLIKVDCFVKRVNHIFNVKRS